jgi:hypothetical protein
MCRSNWPVLLLCCAVFCTAVMRTTMAQTVAIATDATWRAINPKPPTGWNTDVAFDDSDAAGWEFAVTDTKPNNHIWYESISSDQAPANAWFRKVFTLDSPVLAASTLIWLDDNGQVYINGSKIVDDNGSGGSSYDLTLDPTLFRIGQNLIAIHGVDEYTPYHTVGMELTLSVPEPNTRFVVAGVAVPFVLRFRDRRRMPRQLFSFAILKLTRNAGDV